MVAGVNKAEQLQPLETGLSPRSCSEASDYDDEAQFW